MIRALIFDFGNVVAFFDHSLIVTRLAVHAGISAEAIGAALIGSVLEDDYEKGKITSVEFLRLSRETCQLGCDDDAIVQAYCEIFWPNEEVCSLIPRLKPHYRLLLGSNTTELHSKHFRRQFADPLRHFDALVLSHEVGARKPSAAFFQHCVARAGVAAAECLFIDDLPANVAGAKAAGLHGIVYVGADDLLQQLAAHGVRIDPPRL